jgi:hypothetical protein
MVTPGNHGSSVFWSEDWDGAGGSVGGSMFTMDHSTGSGLFNLVAGAYNDANVYKYGSGRGACRLLLADASFSLLLSNSSTGNTRGGLVTWYNSIATANTYVAFYTNNGTQRMTIDASGYVGIGTTTPACLLHVGSGTDSYAQTMGLLCTNPGNNWINACFGQSGLPKVVMGNLSSTAVIGAHSATLNAWANLALCPAGNVGIGNYSPTRPLVVTRAGAALTDCAIMVGNNGSGTGVRIQTYDLVADGNAWMGLGTDMGGNSYEHSLVFPYGTTNQGRQTFGTFNGTTYSTKMTILGTGNVGIATTSPSYTLDVNGSFRASGGNNYFGGWTYFFDTSTSTSPGFDIENQTTFSRIAMRQIRFYDWNGTGDFLTLSGGKLGVNNTSPTWLVDILGNNRSTNLLNLAVTNGTSGSFTTTTRTAATGSNSIWGSVQYYQSLYTANAFFGGYGYGQIAAYQGNDSTIGYFNIATNGTGGFALSGYANGSLSITSGRVYTSSDARMKSNINYISDTSTPKIMGLKPATFSFTTDHNNTLKLGFIAQDVEQFIPVAIDCKKYHYMWKTKRSETGEIVPDLDENGNYQYTDEIRPRSIDNMAILATLIKAFQEQVQVIEDLKQRIQILETPS